MRDFRNLLVWQKSHGLSVATHNAFAGPAQLGSTTQRTQLLRAIASIPANIAEGCGRRTDVEFARYLDIALGSAKESENHLLFARDMGWLDGPTFVQLDAQLAEVRRMLFGLARVMRDRVEKGRSSKA